MRREELYLADLIDNARAVRAYLDGVTRERWDSEDILRDAVLYRMLLPARSPARFRTSSGTATRTWRGGRSGRSVTWPSTSTSGSTGQWSGRSRSEVSLAAAAPRQRGTTGRVTVGQASSVSSRRKRGTSPARRCPASAAEQGSAVGTRRHVRLRETGTIACGKPVLGSAGNG